MEAKKMGFLQNLARAYKLHGRSILNPALWAVWTYHLGVFAYSIRIPPLRWFIGKVYGLNRFFCIIFAGITINRETKIGKDFHIIHAGGIIIAANAVIGDRCGIMHEVTLGTNFGPGVPTIGNDVFIGAGAKILGAITIGDGAIIAANSLVINDVPAGYTAIGVPAKIWKFDQRRKGIEQKPSSDTGVASTMPDKPVEPEAIQS